MLLLALENRRSHPLKRLLTSLGNWNWALVSSRPLYARHCAWCHSSDTCKKPKSQQGSIISNTERWPWNPACSDRSEPKSFLLPKHFHLARRKGKWVLLPGCHSWWNASEMALSDWAPLPVWAPGAFTTSCPFGCRDQLNFGLSWQESKEGETVEVGERSYKGSSIAPGSCSWWKAACWKVSTNQWSSASREP